MQPRARGPVIAVGEVGRAGAPLPSRSPSPLSEPPPRPAPSLLLDLVLTAHFPPPGRASFARQVEPQLAGGKSPGTPGPGDAASSQGLARSEALPWETSGRPRRWHAGNAAPH